MKQIQKNSLLTLEIFGPVVFTTSQMFWVNIKAALTV